jgi:holo-[acyl-carrier protein] synthase
VDVVDIDDFAATLRRSGQQFIADVFTEGEIAYCRGRRPQHYSARWAAKEAFFKATGGRLPDAVTYRDAEIVLDRAGAPQLNLLGAAAAWARRVGLALAVVSLSHSRRTTVAAIILHFEAPGMLRQRARSACRSMLGRTADLFVERLGAALASRT